MRIAFGYGRGVVLTIKELTFQELAELCSKPKKGKKYEEYYLRGGEMTLTEGDPSHFLEAQRSEHFHRNNKSLLKGELLILDGDSSVDNKESAPDPEIIHNALKKLKYNHFIYTTHSHNPPEKIRWRAVIPCVVDYKDTKTNSDAVKITTNKLFDELKETGLGKSNEQNVWSQPWYMPTRDDPEDGHFIFYSFFDGEDYKSVNPERLLNYDKSKPASKQTNLDYESIDDVYADFLKGKHCYTSIRKITYMNIKDGQTKPATIANATALMQASPLRDSDPERWKTTFNQIEKLVDDAYSKIHENDKNIDSSFVSDYDEDNVRIDRKIILPEDDLLTELTLALHGTWWTPNIMASRLSAFSIVAYLAGGKYRSSLGDRVNIQQVAIAPTGAGKDILIKSVINVIQEVWLELINERDKLLSGVIKKVGSSEGVDAKLRGMGDKHDVILTLDEIGGLMRQAKRDMNKQKFFDYALEMYTESDSIYADRAVMRKLEKGQAHILYAPHMIISGATTPNLMLNGIDSDFVGFGNASRMMFFNCGPYVEENLKKCNDLELSKIMKYNLKEIANQDSIKGITPLPDARVFTPKIVDMSEIEDYCWKISKKDKLKTGEFKDIWNRRVANAKKYSMIRAILNDPVNPKVTLDMIENEIEFVGSSCEYSQRIFKNMIGENDLDIAKKSVISRLLKAINSGKKLVPQKILNDTYAMRKVAPQQRKTILNELVDDGIVNRIEQTGRSGRGKKVILYEFSDKEEYEALKDEK